MIFLMHSDYETTCIKFLTLRKNILNENHCWNLRVVDLKVVKLASGKGGDGRVSFLEMRIVQSDHLMVVMEVKVGRFMFRQLKE